MVYDKLVAENALHKDDGALLKEFGEPVNKELPKAPVKKEKPKAKEIKKNG